MKTEIKRIPHRLLAFLLAIMLILTLMPVSAMAENESLITVYVTMSNQGVIASGSDMAHTIMANVPVTIPPGEDGKATVDSVMQAIHSIYCKEGYATSNTDYGISVTKLWGSQTKNNLFFINDIGLTKDVGTDKVANGDHLKASINKDNFYYADWYSEFNTRTKTVAVGETFALTLTGYLGMAYTPEDKIPVVLPGISVGTVSSVGFTALGNKTTSADGTVSLSFDKAGTYIISASGTVSDEVTDYSDMSKKMSDCPVIAPACVVTVQEPSINISMTDVSDGTIPKNGYTYNVGDIATALKVTPSAIMAGGTYTYLWKYKTAIDASSSSNAGSKNQTYTPQTTMDSLRYYFCRVTYKLNENSYTVDSDYVPVKVIATGVQAPTISTQPSGGTYLAGTTGIKAISVGTKYVNDGGKLSYQWYLSRNGEEYQAVMDSKTNSVIPTDNSRCVLQYYAIITNTLESVSGDIYTASVKTNTVTVEFKSAADYGATWNGDGSQTSPYLISSIADLQTLSSLCSGGLTFKCKYFKMMTDITLPDDWIPIGTSANRFCGNIDGDRHLLTIPANGLPLLGYVRYASVSNLNIYGAKIASSGLVAYYSVDSGIEHTINITNCTLKAGSSTLYSGFIGGFASGINTVNIKNCTVESDVVIGYDKSKSNIGSFGGGFNGNVAGCVSYATVYGVNNVGGLVGAKGQSMGECTVRDSAFHGIVEATGNYVGGILGSGYNSSSAPNSPCVSILNCIADGAVSGANYVGGIFGGEGGVIQCWPNGIGYIQNNCFAGTVSATADNAVSGGVIGNMRALDCYNVISNNYFAVTCGADKGVGQVEFVITPETTGSFGSGWGGVNYNGATYGRGDDPTGAGADALAKSYIVAALTDGTLVRALNAGLNSSVDWIQGINGPKFGGRRHLVSITCPSLSTMNGQTALVGGADILFEKMLTLMYSDSTTETVDANIATRDFIVSSDLIGKSIAASIIYNNHQLVFKLNVNASSSTPDLDPNPSSDVTVNFTLIGDEAHGENGKIHTLKAGNLTTWIAPQSVKVASKSTIMTVLAKVLNQNGYSWMNDDESNSNTGNYIQSITSPVGVTLAEFTNGPNSGWMYTLNGSHPLRGVNEQRVDDGDVIVFHYTDDYTKEEGSDKWSGSGGLVSTSGNTENMIISPNATIKDGKANISLSLTDLKDTIVTAKENGGTIIVKPTISGMVAQMNVILAKDALSAVSGQTNANLIVQTPVGNMTLSNAVLDTIVSQAEGSTVTLTFEMVDTKILTVEQKKVVGNDVVYDISIMSGTKHISSFGDKEISINLPYVLKVGETKEKVTVWYMNDKGELEKIQCKYDKETGLATFATNHLSYYIVGYDKSVSFSDVNEKDWFFESVMYAVQKGLFKGTTETTFSPKAPMTRAMLVTVLNRLDTAPTTTALNKFVDINDSDWFVDAVKWSTEKDIVKGITETEFKPNNNITREQLAVMLYRYAKIKGSNIEIKGNIETFVDKQNVSSWAVEALNWSVGNRLITGKENSALDPQGNATRAEVATILKRFVENIK